MRMDDVNAPKLVIARKLNGVNAHLRCQEFSVGIQSLITFNDVIIPSISFVAMI